MIRNRPSDTRYSLAAFAAGLVGGAGLAGALFLLGLAPPLALIVGLGFAACASWTDHSTTK